MNNKKQRARVSAIGVRKCSGRLGTRGMIWRLKAGRSNPPKLGVPAMVSGEVAKRRVHVGRRRPSCSLTLSTCVRAPQASVELFAPVAAWPWRLFASEMFWVRVLFRVSCCSKINNGFEATPVAENVAQ
ncbi:MAG: hypothetical protein IT292_09530 [Deltaproteobacteria bacterium]|nr:hypothetical protein [Deltaproteobacteria bacterium]